MWHSHFQTAYWPGFKASLGLDSHRNWAYNIMNRESVRGGSLGQMCLGVSRARIVGEVGLHIIVRSQTSPTSKLISRRIDHGGEWSLDTLEGGSGVME